ncbi:uncharacterized protein LOC131148986 [Malania oleifera]|uniref:uncharacterized protein LOC131148986 n=1 Tax=Malania oleifera TaxID=397392 RepID=UPI0025AE633F|nr:uncharacterized protein LOC131148986 [Malania oleifera]XP_057954965.1 uncharacterized protein LOC131148986 [Malania oleifera]XP_057954966.1 uncharacterized protein LOC131148986 [Malania oleifera]XP_057954967.1 uncharacterized protein LOC131148986 [Malania oleifera]XP_057954968.1 uncharacterized protein LOC131148986 [Malania oleifera]XP_057954969.1 uncharacterized protein LOC131148986 [Malania oleifera]XP_057954970.1 uncharacterized protein LOC131148986 [Malania oleifera]XP_057954971.1 unc
MDFKALKWQILHGSLARRLLLRVFLVALAMAIFPFVLIVRDVWATEPLISNYDNCPVDDDPNPHLFPGGFVKSTSSFALTLFGSSSSMPCEENENLTVSVFRELMGKNLLGSGSKVLCVGEGSASAVSSLRVLGVSNAFGVHRHPFFSLLQSRFVYKLGFEDNSFDFVFSRALDRVSVPALFVLEVERVLRPGGIGALLVGARDLYSGSLVRSATPVSSFLKSSDILQVCGISSFTLVVFKKRFDSVGYFEWYHLPYECPSVTNNQPFMKHIEPLVKKSPGEHETKISYLPKFVDFSSRNRLIYINIGAGEYLNSSIANWLRPFYPTPPQAFNVYVIDHNTSALSSYVKKPGTTFVYHPGLAGSKATANANSGRDDWIMPPDDEFDFINWFKNTVAAGDFVILLMNARAEELKLLYELFETGSICHVDELFLRCSDSVDCKNSLCGDCMSLLKSLRRSGIFVHQWWGD